MIKNHLVDGQTDKPTLARQYASSLIKLALATSKTTVLVIADSGLKET